MRIIKAGATSQSVYVEILDSASTTGGRKTGIVYNAAGLTAYYARNGGSSAAITLATLAAANSAYSSGGFKEVDATNMPGVYRLDIPDAAIAAGAPSVIVTLKGASGMVQVSLEIQLTAVDFQDGSFMGLPSTTFGIVDSGTAQAVTGTTIKLKAGAPAYDISGATVIVASASTGAGQSRTITSYNTSTKTATVDTWGTTPTGTITYVVLGTPPASSTSLPAVNVTQWNGAAVASPTVAGVPEVRVQAMATDVMNAAALAADAVTEIQTGLASSTTAAAIKAQTDKLTFTVANQVDANIQYVNDVLVNGAGTALNPWGP